MTTRPAGSGLLIALGTLGALVAWAVSARQGIFMLFDPGPLPAILVGAALGLLLAWCLRLSTRLSALERQIGAAGASRQESPDRVESAQVSAPSTAGSMQTSPAASGSALEKERKRRPAAGLGSSGSFRSAGTTAPRSRPLQSRAWKLPAWVFAGNLPVRIGVLVLLVGVAALLRYVTEQGWLDLPIEARLGLVALAGVGGLVFGWVQRGKRRAFALVIQGGAIGVILLTLFAADRLYGVIPGSLSFGVTVALVVGIGLLAALQRAQWLAVFGMLAGFAAPFALGDGQAGPGPLFAWYAILNLGVFGLAWRQHWPLLNRIGFGFTFALTTLWGVLAWSPEHESLAMAYWALFFLLYFTIPILEARRVNAADKVDPVLVFGLPLVAIPLYGLIVEGDRAALAGVTIVAALLYLVSATFLIRRMSRPALGRAHVVLAIALATLAVPLTVSEYTVILIWALQGGALVWYGCRQSSRWTRWSGLLLQAAAAGLWLVLFLLAQAGSAWLKFNADFYGGVALAVAAVVSALAYQRAGAGPVRVGLLTAWALVFWLLNGSHQIGVWLSDFGRATLGVAFLALSAVVAAELHRRARLIGAGLAATVIMLLALFSVSEQFAYGAPLAGWGSLAWLALALAAFHVDRSLSFRSAADPGRRVRPWHALAAHAAVIFAVSASLIHVSQFRLQLGDAWIWLLGAAPLLVLSLWLLKRDDAPLCHRSLAAGDQQLLLAGSLLALGVGLAYSVFAPGAADPLPWLPVLNPLELGQLLSLLLALAALRAGRLHDVSFAPMLLAALALLTISAMALRAVHQLTDIVWQLPALLDDARGQAALTVVWAALGTIAWLWGSRRRQYAVWLAGAVLLGVVLVKLLVVDRTYLSTVAGILSFLAFGVLAIAIGFFAPAPPRSARTTETPR